MRKLIQAEAPWPLVLVGAVGSGKTCAALCLSDAAGPEAIYWTVEAFHAALVQARNGKFIREGYVDSWRVPAQTLWQEWADAPLVVLDELGVRGAVSDPQYETTKRAIDSREGKPAVFISNVGLNALAKLYDDRIASRLAAGTVFHLDTEDRRLDSRREVLG
jgi:DNA replication protein DnaC